MSRTTCVSLLFFLCLVSLVSSLAKFDKSSCEHCRNFVGVETWKDTDLSREMWRKKYGATGIPVLVNVTNHKHEALDMLRTLAPIEPDHFHDNPYNFNPEKLRVALSCESEYPSQYCHSLEDQKAEVAKKMSNNLTHALIGRDNMVQKEDAAKNSTSTFFNYEWYGHFKTKEKFAKVCGKYAEWKICGACTSKISMFVIINA